MAEFLTSMGMVPKHVLTGTPGKLFERRVARILKDVAPGANIRCAADLFLMHQWIKNDPVDLIIGNTYGKHIARAEDIPLVRFGWPILDRVGHSVFPSVGYRGGLRLATTIINTLLDRKDRDDPEERFELVM
jgi:nitrogenase molybdenum-iron protein beta chain